METRHQKGVRGEDLAEALLRDKGLELIDRNVRCRMGEIDLIFRDGKTTVFVEVRSRSTKAYGSPKESVTPGKQRRLTRLAQWFLKTRRLEHLPARFDVIAINWDESGPRLEWIANAFEARE